MSPVAEKAIVTTRSFTGMMLTILLMTAIISEEQAYLEEIRQLPDAAKRCLPS